MVRWLVLVAIAGCYREPRPSCGFVCGEASSCPTGYTCSAADNRCHLDDTSVECDSAIDAGVDSVVVADADTTPPTVVMMNPTGRDVPLDVPIVVVFSEPVTNVNTNTFGVQWTGAGVLSGSVTVSETPPVTATFTPIVALQGSTVYTPQLSVDITDLAGNPLALTEWSFTTAPDPTPLAVDTTDPTDGQMQIPVDTSIRVVFTKSIATFTATSISLDHGATGTIAHDAPLLLVLKPDANLAAATTYTVTVGTDVVDTSGLSLAAPFTFSFTTM